MNTATATTPAWPDQPDLFDICARNHRGNECSVQANRATNKNKDRARILAYLSTVVDATCDELEMALAMNHQTCSARMSELKMDGCIQPTTKRLTRTGCPAQAWKPNAKAS